MTGATRIGWGAAAVTGVLAWTQAIALAVQQNPIVVDVIEQPKPADDISISVVLGIFAIAGLFLLAAAVGSAIVAGGILLYKRWRDRSAPETEPTHTRLRI